MKKQEALEKENKRKESKLKRKQKRSSASPVEKCELKSEILKVPRSVAMLEDKLSHNFVAEGRRVRRAPDVFSPELDARKKHTEEEDDEEESEDEDQDDDEEDEDDDEEGDSSSDIVIEELKPGDRQSSIPKRLSQLEDKLT